jgi:hypothetical protein
VPTIRFPSRLLGLLLFPLAAAMALSQVTGRVVDPEGRPVAGATVAPFWDYTAEAGLQPHRSFRITDEEGLFTMARARLVIVFNGERTLGAYANLEGPGDIRLGPLARFRFQTDPADGHLGVAEIRISVRHASPIFTTEEHLDMQLPVGELSVGFFRRHADLPMTWTPDPAGGDSGVVSMRPGRLFSLRGRPAPSLPDHAPVQIEEFRGFYVLLVYGDWSGFPRFSRELARILDWWEASPAIQENLVILPVARSGITDWLSQWVTGGMRSPIFHGRSLPQPHVVDVEGTIRAAYGLRRDVSVLIDPEGNVVRDFDSGEDFETGLPVPHGLSADQIVDIRLDEMMVNVAWERSQTLPEGLERLRGLGLTIRDFKGLPAPEPLLLAAVEPFTVSLTLRSYLQHLLRPHGLTFRVTEGEIVLFPGALPPPSWKQVYSAKRLEEAMRRPMDVEPDLDSAKRKLLGYNWFRNEAYRPAGRIGAPILIDPEVVRRGGFDLEALRRRPIDLSGPSTLAEIFEQAGLRWWIQDEAIIVSPHLATMAAPDCALTHGSNGSAAAR